MSPLHLRRYRAERLLRSQFEELRATVIGTVRTRMGSALPEADLEACYSMAWQGLYAAIEAGQEIQSPAAWLILVTYRRAVDEQRARREAAELHSHAGAVDPDFAAELDNRAKLRRLMEGLGADLSERERQAACLCYLQGLTREEAARRMGIAPRRMQKLMEGRGDGRPGVAAKVGALTRSIAEGRFCDEHASLMRAFAIGMLDPEGERHRVALAHRESCPACRAYVLSLRGLAAVLPPVCVPGLPGGLDLREGTGTAGRSGRAAGPASRRLSAHLRSRLPGRLPARLQGLGGRLTGSGVSTAKVAAASVVLLGGGAAGVAITAASSGAHAHPDRRRGVFTRSQESAGRGGERPTSSRAKKPRRVARAHRVSHRGGARRSHAAPALPGAVREFGIERPPPAPVTATPAGPSSPATQAQREFGFE
jgi:RNA polymerase sigma factor (sigma-70 family)